MFSSISNISLSSDCFIFSLRFSFPP
jgi:hypothetical protein